MASRMDPKAAPTAMLRCTRAISAAQVVGSSRPSDQPRLKFSNFRRGSNGGWSVSFFRQQNKNFVFKQTAQISQKRLDNRQNSIQVNFIRGSSNVAGLRSVVGLRSTRKRACGDARVQIALLPQASHQPSLARGSVFSSSCPSNTRVRFRLAGTLLGPGNFPLSHTHTRSISLALSLSPSLALALSPCTAWSHSATSFTVPFSNFRRSQCGCEQSMLALKSVWQRMGTAFHTKEYWEKFHRKQGEKPFEWYAPPVRP